MKFLIVLLFSFSAFAQTTTTEQFPTEGSEAVPELVKPPESPVEKVIEQEKPLEKHTVPEPKLESKKEEPKNSREARAESTGTIMVGYQWITSWLPGKKTISYTHIFSESFSLEGEYSTQTLDSPYIGVNLGEMKEKRFTLQARKYVANSFHFTFGGVLSDFRANVDDSILDTFGNEITASFSAQNIGITGGIGNRWQWNNGFTFGVDWIRINIPLIETKIDDDVVDDVASGSEAEDIKDVIRTFNRIPTFVLLGFNLGYTF